MATPLNKRLSAPRFSVFVGIGKISGLQQTVLEFWNKNFFKKNRENVWLGTKWARELS